MNQDYQVVRIRAWWTSKFMYAAEIEKENEKKRRTNEFHLHYAKRKDTKRGATSRLIGSNPNSPCHGAFMPDCFIRCVFVSTT